MARSRARLLGPLAVALVALAPALAFAQAQEAKPRIEVPLPPPPGTLGDPQGVAPAAKPAVERCTGCHAQLTRKPVVHGALLKNDCSACHRPVTTEQGRCRARTASKWSLVRTEPELCYGCHARKDQSKSVHTPVRQGSCLSCHEAHSSNYRGLVNEPREKLCFTCHEVEPLLTKRIKHAPVAEGLCLDCHDAHGGNLPNAIRAESGSAFCLRCHDAKAPTTRGSPGLAFRIDLSKPVVHAALKRVDCLYCHDGGHSSDNPRFLKKAPVDLCYGCHERKDKAKFTHSAVLLGDCVVCHDPHSSDQPKLIVKATVQETCFLCHADDLTGRKVTHAPVAKGCDQCHEPHGSANRFELKNAEGRQGCYKCHKPVDGGKVKHVALERYECTGCHDPHGTGNGALLGQKVNALCISCHPNQKDGTHVTPIAAGGHVVGGELTDPRRVGRDFSCASCHNPHGSDNPKLFYFGANPMQSCDGCHGDKSGGRPELKNLISQAKRRAPAAPTGAAGGGGAGAGAGSAGGAGPGAGGPGAGAGGPGPGSGSGSGGNFQGAVNR